MSNKHDANVKKNTLVNFQIGLIASLLCIYILFEIPTQRPDYTIQEPNDANIEEYVFQIGEVIEEKPKEQKQVRKKKVKPVVFPTKFKEKENDDELEKTEKEFVIDTISSAGNAVAVDSIESINKEEDITYPIGQLAIAPIFPGCENLVNNKETIACFSSKVKRLVSKKFNSGLGAEYGLSGIQKIYVQFEIAKDGTVQQVKVRAPHVSLEKETKRVMQLFPKMEPGKRNNKAVRTVYQLPIIFQIQD